MAAEQLSHSVKELSAPPAALPGGITGEHKELGRDTARRADHRDIPDHKLSASVVGKAGQEPLRNWLSTGQSVLSNCFSFASLDFLEFYFSLFSLFSFSLLPLYLNY